MLNFNIKNYINIDENDKLIINQSEKLETIIENYIQTLLYIIMF